MTSMKLFSACVTQKRFRDIGHVLKNDRHREKKHYSGRPYVEYTVLNDEKKALARSEANFVVFFESLRSSH